MWKSSQHFLQRQTDRPERGVFCATLNFGVGLFIFTIEVIIMSLQVMTMDEVNEVSGGGIGDWFRYHIGGWAWAGWNYAHFTYGDMRGHVYHYVPGYHHVRY